MLNIKSFFQKFAKIQEESAASKEGITNAIKKVTGINLTPNNFTLEEGVLRLSVTPIIRNELYMRKDKIISELTSAGFKVKEIR
ncbi:MAG TPA: hypothetical protein VJH67_02165 [Candidatus Paceibacterota bacterium]